MDTKPEDLKNAYKKEKDARIKIRMAAVNMVIFKNASIEHTADSLMQSTDWVFLWVTRFGEEGLEGLRDLPRTGRPPKVPLKNINKILSKTDHITTPKILCEDIHKKYGVRYHMTSIRRIMRCCNMSAKTSRRVHVNRAEMHDIQRWQRNAKRRISRLIKDGFTVLIQDESIFTHDPVTGVKYWSLKGERVIVGYNGRHRKSIVYGAITTDGRRLFRTYDRFDKETFLAYIKELHRHFGRVLVITDGARQHTASIVNDFVSQNKDVKMLYLPTATPELSAIEEYWHQAKRDVLVSEYYATFERMRHVLSQYIRTSGPRLDVMKYVCRKSITPVNF